MSRGYFSTEPGVIRCGSLEDSYTAAYCHPDATDYVLLKLNRSVYLNDVERRYTNACRHIRDAELADGFRWEDEPCNEN